MNAEPSKMDDLPEHVRRNRAYWDSMAHEWVSAGERNWTREPGWGMWHIPETELHLLPELGGKDAIELGCGTGYVSSWMARRGACVVGIDNSAKQLETAHRLQKEHDLHFPLIHGNAEEVPYPDASFDFAISEYGAAIWCDPYKWIPEAARLLRKGGRLVFLGNATLLMLCSPDDENEAASNVLLRSWFEMHRFEWGGDEGVEFHLNPGDMIRLLRRTGFEVLDLIDLRPPPGLPAPFPYVTTDWARQWPSEEVWIAELRATSG